MVLFPFGCDEASLARLGSDCKLQQPAWNSCIALRE